MEPDRARRDAALQVEQALERQAIDALKTMPPLPQGADAATTATYLQAKVELGRILYKSRQFAELEQLVDPLLKGFEAGQFGLENEARKAEARANLVLLKLYARYGLADAAFNAGQPARVKEITDPIIDAIQKGEYTDLKRNPTLRWGIMGLALRVSIQEGNIPRAHEVLQGMQKFAAEDEGEAGATAVLAQIVLMVREQLREVRKKKDKELLDKTVASFGTFVEELAKQQKSSSPELLRLLAEAFAGLDRHEQAVAYARRVQEPKGGNGQPPDPKQHANYRACRILVVQALRRAGKLDEAEAALQEVRQAPWGKDSFEADKERIHLLAARGKPAAAYAQWRDLVNSLVRRIREPGIKDQYFECYYYMTECYLQWAMTQPEGARRDDAVKRAAGFISRLEVNMPDLGGEESKARFDGLLEREPALKEQYEKLKGTGG
jgi:hypothetical protein